MKKIFTLFTALTVMVSSFASVTPSEPKPVLASEVFIPVGKNLQISLQDLAYIKSKDYETLTGKHMSLANKVSFKIGQRELKNSINNDGTFNSKKLEKFGKKMKVGEGFNIGGFALGFFLLVIGVLIAYVISDDNKAARTKWAWIGLGVAVVLSLLFLL